MTHQYEMRTDMKMLTKGTPLRTRPGVSPSHFAPSLLRPSRLFTSSLTVCVMVACGSSKSTNNGYTGTVTNHGVDASVSSSSSSSGGGGGGDDSSFQSTEDAPSTNEDATSDATGEGDGETDGTAPSEAGDDATADAGPVVDDGSTAEDTGAGDAGPSCDNTSCAGCCDATHTCQPGSATAACGTGGTACHDCGASACTSGVCANAASDSGLPSACVGITCIAPDDCVYLEVLVAFGPGNPMCNFSMCSYASGHGVCQ